MPTRFGLYDSGTAPRVWQRENYESHAGLPMMDQIPIPESDEELLAQCEVDTFCSGGKGGQHQNRTETGVRLIHVPSGVTVTSRNERSQHMNKKQCLANLRRKLEKLNHRDKPRKPTKTPRGVKMKRLEEKTKRAEKKQLRKRPSSRED